MSQSNPFLRVVPLQRAMAEACAADYCREHGLSMEKLKRQKLETLADMMVFAQPTGVAPDGLRNDIATRPFPTLVIRLDESGQLVVESTQHTAKYLAN